ncbi:gamma-glutamyl-gamma-aminobutyrate hydrolase family protein [Sedimenticola hydrogenitrophicus]|uniref:gamma-glutamyl-gamma-aminobutyrate hydrolase family protein n=1 Tax=Sedimenticola hydrogenitrophicus TaxID=2967975 RepID=UPI0023B02363|nr:gamma-glutamyl-gamma-aminobutyrate hydrolase family protein [Sedimenticola hydrogenitrophicus]
MAASGYVEDRDGLAQNWSRFLAKALPGAHWMSLPNLGPDNIVAYCQGWGIDRVILSGGNDIGSVPLRDATELKLLDWAEECLIPVLGICRGMQVMAHRAGTALVPVEGHVATRHVIHGMRDGMVNSFHNLALIEGPPGYKVLAKSEDGCIEAIRHSMLPWEGWMWHPERELEPGPQDIEGILGLFT